ncbi:hypothetical protein XM48_07435 [Leucobacter sp. Ag1]|nr:hypothetical protein XM48_07435 [Leucobacter sp. Ag1]
MEQLGFALAEASRACAIAIGPLSEAFAKIAAAVARVDLAELKMAAYRLEVDLARKRSYLESERHQLGLIRMTHRRDPVAQVEAVADYFTRRAHRELDELLDRLGGRPTAGEHTRVFHAPAGFTVPLTPVTAVEFAPRAEEQWDPPEFPFVVEMTVDPEVAAHLHYMVSTTPPRPLGRAARIRRWLGINPLRRFVYWLGIRPKVGSVFRSPSLALIYTFRSRRRERSPQNRSTND